MRDGIGTKAADYELRYAVERCTLNSDPLPFRKRGVSSWGDSSTCGECISVTERLLARIALQRRGLLASLAGQALLSSGLPTSGARAQVDPATAIMIANFAVSLFQAFAGSSDGGLSAMMRAQNEKLSLIIAQLGELRVQLGKLHSSVSQLPKQVQQISDLSRTMTHIESLGGAIAQWRQIASSIVAGQVDLTDDQRKDLEHVRFRAWDARTALSANEIGYGAAAATVVTSTLGLESFSEVKLRGVSHSLKNILQDHINWCSRIRDLDQIGSAARAKETVIRDIKDKVEQIKSLSYVGDLLKYNPVQPDPIFVHPSYPPISVYPPTDMFQDLLERREWRVSDLRAEKNEVSCYQENSPAYDRYTQPRYDPDGPPRQDIIRVKEVFGRSPLARIVWVLEVKTTNDLRQWSLTSEEFEKKPSLTPSADAASLKECQPARVEGKFAISDKEAYDRARNRPPVSEVRKQLAQAKDLIAELNVLEASKTFTERSLDLASQAEVKALNLLKEIG